jgi:hypothetical protein
MEKRFRSRRVQPRVRLGLLGIHSCVVACLGGTVPPEPGRVAPAAEPQRCENGTTPPVEAVTTGCAPLVLEPVLSAPCARVCGSSPCSTADDATFVAKLTNGATQRVGLLLGVDLRILAVGLRQSRPTEFRDRVDSPPGPADMRSLERLLVLGPGEAAMLQFALSSALDWASAPSVTGWYDIEVTVESAPVDIEFVVAGFLWARSWFQVLASMLLSDWRDSGENGAATDVAACPRQTVVTLGRILAMLGAASPDTLGGPEARPWRCTLKIPIWLEGTGA